MNHTDAIKGMTVNFGRKNGEQTLGEIIKVNTKKLKVKQLESRGTMRNYPVGTIWTVPASMCTPANGQTASAPVAPSYTPPVSTDGFKKGDEVFFGRNNGEKTLGKIVKVNRKTYKVEQLESRGRSTRNRIGTLWTVPKSLVTSANEQRPARTQDARKRPCLVNVLTGKRTYGQPGESNYSLYGRMANGLM